jgi:hypothetical protein
MAAGTLGTGLSLRTRRPRQRLDVHGRVEEGDWAQVTLVAFLARFAGRSRRALDRLECETPVSSAEVSTFIAEI